MQKYILTLLVACVCTYTNAQDSSFKMDRVPVLAADTTQPQKPIIESVPRTEAASQPVGTTTATTTTTTTTTTATPPTNEYGEVYSEAIKTKEGYWVIGISPTFTEPPAGVQGSYTLGYGDGMTTPTTTTTIATDNYTPATTTYTTPVTSTDTPAPAYTSEVVSSGKMYRVQLSATKKYRAERYEKLFDLGSIVLEDTETKKGTFTRVLLDGFYTLEDARRALTTVKERGNERAFVVVYDNGVRQKGIYRK